MNTPPVHGLAGFLTFYYISYIVHLVVLLEMEIYMEKLYLSMWKTKDGSWVLTVRVEVPEEQKERKIMFSTVEKVGISIGETFKAGVMRIIKLASIQNNIEREKVIIEISSSVPFPEELQEIGSVLLRKSVW